MFEVPMKSGSLDLASPLNATDIMTKCSVAILVCGTKKNWQIICEPVTLS